MVVLGGRKLVIFIVEKRIYQRAQGTDMAILGRCVSHLFALKADGQSFAKVHCSHNGLRARQMARPW